MGDGREPDGAPRKPAKPKPKSKSQVQDESIMGTNNSSIVSKRSVERLYFLNEPHFLRYFVKKPQRRSPLINRGYWLRMRAIDQVVRHFLEQSPDKPRVIINLGCGYDPLPWQCLTRYPLACNGATFVDIDYKELMMKKRDVVASTTALNAMLKGMQVPLEGNVLLRSDEYIQLGCDLRDLRSLQEIILSTVDVLESRILLIAEVSITYMDVEAADALIRWAGTLTQATFCLLEQLLPAGIEHPFAHTMMAHFDKLQTPLKAAQKYPTLTAQSNRFKSLGWSSVSVRNLWELWSSHHFATISERKELDNIEPFDEWEEFSLFGCHYFLLVANTVSMPPRNFEFTSSIPADPPMCSADATECLQISYQAYPKSQGHNRFAAAMKVGNRPQDAVGVFGGMGQITRVNSMDIYNADTTSPSTSFHIYGASIPSSRMCHTLTDIGDMGALLVGGRTSPDNGLTDCWLLHKWLNQWERVDDLPVSLYRHQAVHLGCGHVLVSTGRVNSRKISSSWYIWSRRRGWTKCVYDEHSKSPIATYGATLVVYACESDKTLSNSRQGLYLGGLAEGGLLQQSIWKFEVNNVSTEKPTLTFKATKSKYTSTIARFGASIIHHKDRTYLLGGVLKDHILALADEICVLDCRDCFAASVQLMQFPINPRPLLIGISVADTRDSFIVMGGAAVCFSFGTFWNKGCYSFSTTQRIPRHGEAISVKEPSITPWRFIHATEGLQLIEETQRTHSTSTAVRTPVEISRVHITSAEHFDKLLQTSQPVILEQLKIGPCCSKWTTEYLKKQIGTEREIIVHEATEEHMSFKTKNFVYSPKTFGDFLDRVEAGDKLYLRSLSREGPSEKAANIATDFPEISADFSLPPELRLVAATLHSSPLRISGPVTMWLHYDVMANVLCQIRGSKRLLLFPPSDIKHFEFEPGASSSNVNAFEKLHDPSLAATHPHEALLHPGDILFLPPFWLHTASPTSGVSVAVNSFFRNFQGVLYAAGKDVYGNRDLQAYEKGRQDIMRVVKSFDHFPIEARGFYLQRLAEEFGQKATWH